MVYLYPTGLSPSIEIKKGAPSPISFISLRLVPQSRPQLVPSPSQGQLNYGCRPICPICSNRDRAGPLSTGRALDPLYLYGGEALSIYMVIGREAPLRNN